MYNLSLFGSVSLSGPSGALEGRVTQRRPLALLSLLASTKNGLLSRDKLVARLWPEAESDRARHRLSVTLHAIRKALGKESVLSVGDDLRLNPDVVDVDVRRFEAALEEDEPSRAVELYRGPFMDGFHLDGAPGFERWLEAERSRLGRRYRGALERLAEEAEAEGDVRRALELWRRLADHDPYSSRVALRLMRALERAGDRPGALRVARAHGRLVRDDMGLEPDPEVATLAERLENGEVEREEGSAPAAVVRAPLSAKPASDTGGADKSPASSKRSDSADTREKWAFRSSSSGVAAAAVGILLLLIGAFATLGSSGREPAYDAKSVLVDLFQNRTDDPELAEMGRMATDWITQGLSYTGFVNVVTLGTPLLAKTPELDRADLPERRERLERIAREHGTGTLVWGNVYRRGDSLYFGAHVTDARDHRELTSLEPVAASVEAPLLALEKLRDRVMTALATRTDPRLEKWQRNASKPPSFHAYEKFVKGLELHTTHGRFEEAASRFLEAAALDPDFTMARLWAVMSLGTYTLDRWEEADSILQELDARRETLAPLDQAFLDYQLARRDFRSGERDAMGMLRAARRMVEIAPGSEYLKLAGQVALWANRPAEAVRHYERADPESGWLRGWEPYWSRFARALHWVGDHERALEVARRGRALYPDNRSIRQQELRALAALGRIEEVETAVADLRKLGRPWAGTVMAYTASELKAHGHEREGRELFRAAAEWEMERLAEAERQGRETRGIRIALSYLLRDVDLAGAKEQITVLLREHPEDFSVLQSAALLNAHQGRRAAAMEFVRRIEEHHAPAHLGVAAKVAALFGERDRAVRLLRELHEDRRPNTFYYRHAGEFEALRDYPPFQEFLRLKE